LLTPHRRRKEERFTINEKIKFNESPVLIEDISISGCKIKHSFKKRIVEHGTVIKLRIPDIFDKRSMKVYNNIIDIN